MGFEAEQGTGGGGGGVASVNGTPNRITSTMGANPIINIDSAFETNLVHTTGNETIGGVKTFTSTPIAPGYSIPLGTDQQVLLGDGSNTNFSTIVSGGQTAFFTWKYSSNTTPADPGNGNFRADNISGPSVTKLYFDDLTSNNQVDISNLFAKVNGSWLIHIQQRNDATKWIQFTTSISYTDNTGWWTVPVTFVQEGGGGSLTNLTDCLVTFVNQNNTPSALGNTGALIYDGMTAASTTTVNIGALKGWVVDNETDPLNPVQIYIDYPGATGVTVPTIGSGSLSYLSFMPDGLGSATLVWSNTIPTSAQRKTAIYASKASHPNLTTLGVVGNETDYITSPLFLARDFFQGFPYLNKGIHTTASAANLTFATSTGKIIGDGINFYLSRTNPNEISRTGTNPTSFFYRTQLGGSTGPVSNIDPTMYDVGGVITAIPGGVNVSTIQYIYAVPFNGAIGFVTQYGQTLYNNLAGARAAVGKEEPVVFPNLVSDAILVGFLAVRQGATNLTDLTQAQFFKADMFGQSAGGAGGTSVSTLQQSYNNSGVVNPQILTSTANDGVKFRRGSATDTDNVLVVQDGSGTARWQVNGLGEVSYWRGMAGTPTRVGNTSFTITDTANANLYDLKYGRTTVLKWTDTAVTKMAMIVNTSYSANNVTITIIGDTLAASATMGTMSYSHEKCKPVILAIAGTLATGTDLTGRYNVPCMMKIFGADGYHTTAGTTNATTYDINLNGTTFMTTKLSIASGATSGLGFTADSGTVTGSPNSGAQSISVDCDSVSTTAPIDAYLELFMMPLNNQYL